MIDLKTQNVAPDPAKVPETSSTPPKGSSYCPDCDGWDNPNCTHGRYIGPYMSWDRGYGGSGSNPF